MALDKQFVLRLEKSIYQDFSRRAGEENLSVNMLLNRLVSLYLEGKIDIGVQENNTEETSGKLDLLVAEIEEIKSRLQLLESHSSQLLFSQEIDHNNIVNNFDIDNSIDNNIVKSEADIDDSGNAVLHNDIDNNIVKSETDTDDSANIISHIDIDNSIVKSEADIDDSSNFISDIDIDNNTDNDIIQENNLESSDLIVDNTNSDFKLEVNIDFPEPQVQEIDTRLANNTVDLELNTNTDEQESDYEIPPAVLELFEQQEKERQGKILDAAGLTKRDLKNPPEWFSRLQHLGQGWYRIDIKSIHPYH